MIILDVKEASKTNKHGIRVDEEFADILEDETDVDEQPLDSGDVMFMGRQSDGKLSVSIGIELKKVPEDLMASMRDGRLMSQLPRLLEEYDLAYLFLINNDIDVNWETGKVKERKKKRWVDSPYDFHYMNSILAKFEAGGGRIRKVSSVKEAAALTLSLYTYWRKPKHSEETFTKKKYKFYDWKQIENPLAECYERMPIRLGIKRAIKLAKVAPSFLDLLVMDKKDLMNVPGLGRKSAEEIYNYVRTGSTNIT